MRKDLRLERAGCVELAGRDDDDDERDDDLE